MKFCPALFNIYLLLFIALPLCGCKTPEEKKRDKEITRLSLHMESPYDPTGKNERIAIYRSRPVMINVRKEPFLDEGHILRAAVTDDPGGGYSIRLEFNRQGAWLLENVTTANKNKRVAVLVFFDEPRWLAAQYIQRGITDGTLTFTPDATREEAERIVRGLNNMAKKLNKGTNIGRD